MAVKSVHRISTPKLHQKTILLVGTLNPTPTPMLIGAPTVIVPSSPKPMTPYFSQIFKIKPGSFFGFSAAGLRNLLNHFLIKSPRYAATKTPTSPPTVLAAKITNGFNLNAKPAGMAA